MSGTEMQYKYAVVKIEDIDNLLLDAESKMMYRILNSINVKREMFGKKYNRYIVINTDEPYAPQIVEILKTNGHWGEGDPDIQPIQSISQLVQAAHQNAIDKGWYEEPRSFGEDIALMHSELSEALEDHRNGYGLQQIYFEGEKPCGIPVELADTVIRIFDVCGHLGIDLETAIRIKMAYNSTRPIRHGGKKL